MLSRIARQNGGNQTAHLVVATPQTQDEPTFAARKETADVFHQWRPAARLTQSLDEKQRDEHRYRRTSPHHESCDHGAEHSQENNPARTEPISRHAPEELTNRIRGEKCAINP